MIEKYAKTNRWIMNMCEYTSRYMSWPTECVWCVCTWVICIWRAGEGAKERKMIGRRGRNLREEREGDRTTERCGRRLIYYCYGSGKIKFQQNHLLFLLVIFVSTFGIIGCKFWDWLNFTFLRKENIWYFLM